MGKAGQFSLSWLFATVGVCGAAMGLSRMAWSAASTLDGDTLGLLAWFAGMGLLALVVGLVYIHAQG